MYTQSNELILDENLVLSFSDDSEICILDGNIENGFYIKSQNLENLKIHTNLNVATTRQVGVRGGGKVNNYFFKFYKNLSNINHLEIPITDRMKFGIGQFNNGDILTIEIYDFEIGRVVRGAKSTTTFNYNDNKISGNIKQLLYKVHFKILQNDININKNNIIESGIPK